jgi:hypothetical protein
MNAARFKEQIKTYAAKEKLSYDDAVYELEREQCRRELARKSGQKDHEPKRVICWCDEGVINGRRVVVHRACDCEYVAARSALVPEAARIATQRVGDPIGDAERGYAWTKIFNIEMDRLAAPILRQSENGRREQKAI